MNTSEIARYSGATLRQLDYWSRLGLFTGSAGSGIGSGNSREWDDAQVVLARALVLVSRIGKVEVARFAGVEAEIRTAFEGDRTLPGLFLSLAAGSVVVGPPYRPKQAAMMVNLTACAQHVMEMRETGESDAAVR